MIITIMVFIVVRGGQGATARLTVDVEVIPPPQNAERVLMTEVPEAVRLRVRGSQRVVQLVDEEEIPPVVLDLSGEREGPFRLDAALFKLPPGLEVVSVRPATVGLRYEPRVEQEVVVVPILTGQVAAGHHVVDPVKVLPPRLTLSGPRSVVRDTQEVQTELIAVDGLGPGRQKRKALLQRPPHNCRYVGVDQVLVSFEVEADWSERTFGEVPVAVRGVDWPATAESVAIVLRGNPALLQQVNRPDLVPFVDLSEAGSVPRTYRRQVRLEGVPEAVRATIIPSSVTIQVRQEEQPTADGGQ
jgi:YbbR domain-containing protein